MNIAVANNLDQKYSIQRQTYKEEEFQELKSQISLTLQQNPAWKHEWCTDLTLQRFLRHHGNAATAHEYLVKFCRWREINHIENITAHHPDVQIEIKTNRSEILDTVDACGRPVVLFRAKNHNKNHGNLERVEKHVIYVFEEVSRLSDQIADGKFTSVFDLQGFGYQNMDLEVVKRALGLLGRYYPQRIGVILLVNYSLVFYGFWKIVRLLLGEKERSRVIFCGKNELADFLDITSPPFNVVLKCSGSLEAQTAVPQIQSSTILRMSDG